MVVTQLDSGEISASAPCASPGHVMLGGACTIHEAAAVKAHMLEQFSKAGPYELDGTAVERIDAAGVQLIVAFALDCLERNRGFFWKGKSEVLDQAVALLGVGSLLESPGVSTVAGAG